MADGVPMSAPDFGSLHAFLGSTSESDGYTPSGRPTAQKAPMPTASSQLPSKPQRDVMGGLSKKVAFKMLKQLGCEVRRAAADGDADGEPYIEISVKEQPVLFQMLLEFGYAPQKGEDGHSAVRVVERRQRKQDEVSADLAAPRKSQASQESSENEGWPSVPRPRLRLDEEQELVKRLARRSSKPAEEKPPVAPEAPKFRSAADQKAHLERLFRPKAADTIDVDLEKVAAQVAAVSSRARPSMPWPSKSDAPARKVSARPPETEVPKSSSSRSKVASLKEVRPSPRLAQAGLLALGSRTPSPACDSTGSSARSPDPLAFGSGGREADSPATAAGDEEPLLAASEAASTEPSECREDASDLQQKSEISDTPLTRGSLNRSQSGELSLQISEYGEWLDKLLGPPSWPGRPAEKRSKAEQRQRLDQLAKPRQRPDAAKKDEEQREAPPRSPRSQREICSRLSAPRQPRPTQSSESPEPFDPDAEELGPDVDAGDVQVRVVPSLLAQCPSRLEPIDEERSFQLERERERDRDRQDKSRRAGRSNSASVPRSGTVATPYSIPVVPEKVLQALTPVAPARRPQRRRAPPPPSHSSRGARPVSAETSDLTDEEAMEYLAQLRAEGDRSLEDEAMLQNIDLLYNQLLGGLEGRRVEFGDDDTEFVEDWQYGGSSSSSSAPRQRGLASVHEVAATPTPQNGGYPPRGTEAARPVVPPRPPVDIEEQGEVLLANIDRLYGEMLHGKVGGASPHRPGRTEPEDVEIAVPPPPPLQSRPAQAAQAVVTPRPPPDSARSSISTDRSAELPSMLEEVLWSALLLGRGSGGRVDTQAKLLELLPIELLAVSLRPALSGPLLSASLRQRVAVELPAVQAAVDQLPASAVQVVITPQLARIVRQARDCFLSLASSSELSAEDIINAPPSRPASSSKGSAANLAADVSETSSQAPPKRSQSKPRRSALSYWTPESLEALEVPRAAARGGRQMVK